MNLQERVTRILKQPKQEWPVIEAEPTDIATLYKSYIVPLAAIPVVCNFIGRVVFGMPVPFVGRYRFGVGEALRAAVFEYIGALVGAFVAAFIVSKLAPTFGSRDDQRQALKLVAYSSTAVWIAGVLNLVPALSVLVIFAAVYCVYVYYLGVPVMMKTPPDKVIAYMVVSVLVVIVVYFVLALIMGVAGGVGGMMSGGAL
ncbi:MAG: YIP1 family protein [Acidobacteria bacterium]|nr:YIP1 family protein [Acidobacteriota bacterium]